MDYRGGPPGGGGRHRPMSVQPPPTSSSSAASGGQRPPRRVGSQPNDLDASKGIGSSPTHSMGSSSSEGPDSGHHHQRPPLRNTGNSSQVQNEEVPLLGGEGIVTVFSDLTYLCPYSIPGAMKGSLTVTNYKLYFSSSYKEWPLILDIPLGFVSRVEKVGGQRSSGENAYGLEIFCKDIRSLRFSLSKTEGHARKDIFETVKISHFKNQLNLIVINLEVVKLMVIKRKFGSV